MVLVGTTAVDNAIINYIGSIYIILYTGLNLCDSILIDSPFGLSYTHCVGRLLVPISMSYP